MENLCYMACRAAWLGCAFVVLESGFGDGGSEVVVWITDGRIQGSGTATSCQYVKRPTPLNLLPWLVFSMSVIENYGCLC